MCWLDYVRDQGFECPSSSECFLYMLSIVDYKKRSIKDGVDFLMSNCPTLDRVVIGMAKLSSVKPELSDPESVIENYFNETRADYAEKVKQVRIPKEIEPEVEHIAREINFSMKDREAESFEDTCEKLLDIIRRKKQLGSN